jgi:transcription termination factor NusA
MAAVTKIPGIGERTAESLAQHGFTTIAQLAKASVDDLVVVHGFGAIRAAVVIETAASLVAKK